MESLLECGVCLTEYNTKAQRPKSLPCGHSTCESCVKDNLKASQGKMKCPFCRSPCGIGVKTVDEFPTTYALLSLIDTGTQKSPSETLSPREKEKKIFQQKKQAEYDQTGAHISNCNEHLQKILHAKEAQESVMQSISHRKKKLLEDYQKEQKQIEEEEKKATSINHQLDDIAAEGNDIVNGLEALQDRVKSASSLLGLNMARQDLQKYYTASQDWVKSRVKSILQGDTHLTKVKILSTGNNVTQNSKCQKQFLSGELYYTCLQCQTDASSKMCGSCFVNSTHWDHRQETKKAMLGDLCHCGKSDQWKYEPTCKTHLKIDKTPTKACDATVYSLSKCKQIFFTGEKWFSCPECRSRSDVCLCGTCFLNSPHINHKFTTGSFGADGGFCDCGFKEGWKKNETCNIHSGDL